MTRFLIVLVLTLGLVVEMALRLAVCLAIALTLVGLLYLSYEDTTETLVRPSLASFLTKVLEPT